MVPAPVLRLQRFSYAFPGSADDVLKEISMEVYPGQCHCLTGPTGCGKTTLLMAVRGLLPPGRRAGTLDVLNGAAGDGLALAGIVLQNPVTQLISAELGAEVAFGLENHCIPPAQMPPMVHRALADVGLGRSGETPIAVLSMGQQYRACLAGTLVVSPAIVLLDEPGAQLDSAGLQRLAQVIAHLKNNGKAVLVCEHRPGFLTAVTDQYWEFTPDGRLRTGSREAAPISLADGGASSRPPKMAGPPADAAAGNPGGAASRNARTAVIQVRELALPGTLDGSQRSLLSFSLAEGERVAVCGPNGAGKTTLVNYLAGLSRPPAGCLEIFGTAPEPHRLRGTAGVLFQNPRRQLFATTVYEEVAFAARRQQLGRSGHDVTESVRSLLDSLDLTALADRSPHLLSYGQKHMVSLAAVLAGRPRVLILDDPLAGLDQDKAQRVLDLLTHLSEEEGTTVLCTGHHEDPWDGWADRIVRLEPGPDRAASGALFAPLGSNIPEASGSRTILWPVPTGVALVISIGLSMAAFAARSLPLLAILTGINLSLLFLRCTHPGVLLRRSARFFVWQAAIITLLYVLRFGWQSGGVSGLRVAWQLFLAFWPGMIFIASNPASRVTRALARVLPQQTAFVVSACLRFLPLLLGEMNAIRQAQVFRGAGLLREDLKKPRYWPDWLHCLLVPTLVRALSLASDIALAATARDFGLYKKRTHWPGDA
jgi:energy-coupling factor transporter ATP-binding protein EcfA2/energy-coupling factor transporter transmembrane protein EcfT